MNKKYRIIIYTISYRVLKRLRDMSLALLLAIFIKIVLDFTQQNNYIYIIATTFALTIILDSIIISIEKKIGGMK